MDIVPVQELLDMARQRADMESDPFWTDDNILREMTRSYKRMYKLIATQYQRHFVKSERTTFTTTGAQDYDLPDDFYVMAGVEQQVDASSDSWATMLPLNWPERNRYQTPFYIRGPWLVARNKYIIFGDKIRIAPKPDSSLIIGLWYTPVPKTLALTVPMDDDTVTDAIEVVNGFDEYIICDTAIKMLGKEESDTMDLKEMRQQAELDIQNCCAPRDEGATETIADVSNLNGDFGWGNRGPI